MSEKRAYKSTLRDEQAKHTRTLIVDALIEQVCDTGRNDFSMSEVAERAGVSVRTLYRHFPKREDLLDAINEEIEKTSAPRSVEQIGDVQAHIADLLEWFEENPRLINASHVAGLGRELRERGRRRRGVKAQGQIDAWLETLPEAERQRAWAVFRAFFGSHTWRTMRFELELGAEETADAFGWVLRLMMDDLNRRLEEVAREGEE